ncbi:MAG: hypothetical protein QM528_06225 [Phycisphaerales bacterium]|nr:hypothetical protein [Phycisphaerales bacterium]
MKNKQINIGVILTRNEVKQESLKSLVGGKNGSCCQEDSCITLSGKTFYCLMAFGKCWFENRSCTIDGSCEPSAPCWCGAEGTDAWECA